MGQFRRVFDVAAAIVLVAGITMLVRPGSRGPQVVTALGQAWVNAAQGTVGATLAPASDYPSSNLV